MFIKLILLAKSKISGINDNGIVMGSKKQKLDFNELQNVSQFLNTNNNQSVQVSNSHDMDGIIICDGDSLVIKIFLKYFFLSYQFKI